ncbi:MAG: N-acetyltransferase [Flavobacterium sp.]|nr:MAG: N-acetyltransferase [Flavobacterium sp.]
MFIFADQFLVMINQIEISTERFLLKSITPQIINTLFEEKTEGEIKKFFDADESEYAHLKSMYEGGMETHRLSMFYFLVVDKKDNRIIGNCGFHTWNRTHKRTEFFYALKYEEDKRKGIMTEVVAKVLDFGFTTLELHRIEALVGRHNIASIKLLERFQFTKEGTMREDYVVADKNEDSECYSLLKWEWEQNKN